MAEPPRRKARPTKSFSLPPRHADNRRVFSYLRGRGIDPEIINHCIKHGLLYESAQHHNCVFVGFAGDRPAYAMQRGTLHDKRFVGEVVGSDKRYSFAVPMTPGDSPIQRMDNLLESLPLKEQACREKLSDLHNQLETAKVEVLKPFPREEELQTKLARLEELNALLNMDKREPEVVAETEAPDNSQQSPTRKTTELER